ncbi:MAG: NADH-quinone oxidoreductase subunit NuoG [Rudaea sp.]|nr:NADH-quinone oxidoreductase subunit NuoG [Rudaea sp.]
MSAQPTTPNTASDPVKLDLVNIEIDGKAMQVPKNSMIIQAADKAGIPIPRFCYHQKLPIAANCRMCMVETEMGGKPVPKPQPACATPVMEGMKVFTQSQRALSAQRNVMEFLLINHPLDCPICDQGGECELQDLSMGYGRSVSRFAERKRVVPDEDIGPLIETEMTRCIQCTRCVRFVGEIAGSYELGGMGRGENLEIGTYIGKTIDSELGGNIIDVCPVGALTDKVYRFKARAWELIARESIGYHDALGANLWLHTRRGQVLRAVPRDNEAINECWLSDRDRYSHQGLYAEDRASRPMIKRDGAWAEVGWDEALAFAAGRLKSVRAMELGTLVHPATSCEEGYLLAKVIGGLDGVHIDHRLRQLDLSDDAVATTFQMPVADIEQAGAILLVGCNLRHELPLVNHRVRKAWKHGAKIYAINPLDFDFNFDLAGKTIANPEAMVDALLRLAGAGDGAGVAQDLAQAIARAGSDDAARAMHAALGQAGSSAVIFGESAAMHPQAVWLRAAARVVAKSTNSAYNEIPAGANAIGLARVGALPVKDGLNARTQLAQARKAYVLYNVEPEFDCADSAVAMKAMRNAECIIAFATFASARLRELAHVILPIGALPEIDATMINVDGVVQTVAAGAKLPGEARQGWKVLRALGAQLGTAGFDFVEVDDVRAAMQPALEIKSTLPQDGKLGARAFTSSGLVRIATVPIYRGDAVLRRASALQAHPLTGTAAVGLHPEDALALGLTHGAQARVSGEGGEAVLPVVVTRAVPRGGAWIESAWAETSVLPPTGSALTVVRAGA